MTEFTNLTTNIEEATFDKDESLRQSQEPVVYKPLVRDIVHGGTYDRVFFRTVTYKNDKLRCSGGVVMPQAFLEMMSPDQRNQAMALFDQGLLIVQICSATTYFSRKHNQLKAAKAQHVQPDIRRFYLPVEIAATESPCKAKHVDAERNMQRKLFVNVTQLSNDDTDSITLPNWVVRALTMIEGQSACIQLPKWPARLHFYDAKTVQLLPMTVNYFKVVEMFAEEPRKLPIALKESLSRYKVLIHCSQIDLFIGGETLKIKLKLSEPGGQLWVLNSNPLKLRIDIKLTNELEKCAIEMCQTLLKYKTDNAILMKEGLDLNEVMRQKGLDFDVMERMEADHRERIRKMSRRTVKPHIAVQNELLDLDDELDSTEQIRFLEPSPLKLQEPAMDHLPIQEIKTSLPNHLNFKDVILRQSNGGATVGSSAQLNSFDGELCLTSSRSNLNKPRFTDLATNLAQVGGEGTMSHLWPTGTINSGARQRRARAFVGQTVSRTGLTMVGQELGKVAGQAANNIKVVKSRRQNREAQSATARSKIPSHQVAMDKQIHVMSPSILRLNSKDCLELTSTSKTGESKRSFLLSQFTPVRLQEKCLNDRISVPIPMPLPLPDQMFVVPMSKTNMPMNHQSSIVTASIDESSQPKELEVYNSQREEKKTSILKIIRGNLESIDVHSCNKLSVSNLHNRAAQSIRNITWPSAKTTNSNAFTPLGRTPPNQEPVSSLIKTPLVHLASRQMHTQQNQLTIAPTNSELLPVTFDLGKKRTNRDLDAVSSNLGSHTDRNDEFLKTLVREKSQTASDSVKKLVDPMTVTRNIAVKRKSNVVSVMGQKVASGAQRLSRSPSNNDIHSELITYETGQHRNLPIFDTATNIQDLVNRDFHKISSTKMSEFQTTVIPIAHKTGHSVINMSASAANPQAKDSTGSIVKHLSRGTLNKSSAHGHISVLASHKLYESNQSVFERLTARQPESTQGDEFKSVLRIIDSIRPDQYHYYAKRLANQNIRCSKHQKNQKQLNQFDSNLYKLDQAISDISSRQRAHSSYGLNRKRSLASQLKYNDRMLQKGVTGSPIPHPICSMHPKNAMTATGSTCEQSSPQMTAFFVVDEEDQVMTAAAAEQAGTRKVIDVDRQQAKVLMLTASGSKLVALNKMDTQGLQQQTVQQDDSTAFYDSKPLNMAIIDKSQEQKNKQFSTLQQQPSVPLYKAVTNKKFDGGFVYSNSQTRPQRSVKTGQLSKLFQQYNKKISEQRHDQQKKARAARFRSSNITTRETTAYRLDKRTLADSKSASIGGRQQKRKKRDATTLCIIQPKDLQPGSEHLDQGTMDDVQSSQVISQDQFHDQVEYDHEPVDARTDSDCDQKILAQNQQLGVPNMNHAVSVIYKCTEFAAGGESSHLVYSRQPNRISKDLLGQMNRTFDSVNAAVVDTNHAACQGTFSSVGTKVIQSMEGGIVTRDTPSSIDRTTAYAEGNAIIEINVNRMDVCQVGDITCAKKDTSEREKVQPNMIRQPTLSPMLISTDGRVNHDFFPANRVSKRDSSVGRNSALRTASANGGPIAKNNNVDFLCTDLRRQGTFGVDRILIRKKQKRNPKRVVVQQIRRSVDTPVTETSLRFDRDSQKLLMMEESKGALTIWPFNTAKGPPKVKSTPATCRIKWRIIKQKVAQSPVRDSEPKTARLQRLQLPNSSLQPRRRIKTLNTLCPQIVQTQSPLQGMGAFLSPTTTNNSRASFYLETNQIILSQRSSTTNK